MEISTENRIAKFICVPIEIWETKELSWNEKRLFIQIDSFTSKDLPCFMSNQYIADFLETSESTAKRTLSSLIKKGYVVVESFDGRRRYIRTTFGYCNIEQPNSSKMKHQGVQNWSTSKVNNKPISNSKFNKTKNNNKIIKKENRVETGDYEVTPSYVMSKPHNAEYYLDTWISDDILVGEYCRTVGVPVEYVGYILDKFVSFSLSGSVNYHNRSEFNSHFRNWSLKMIDKLKSECETDMACKEIKELYNDDNAGQVLLDYSKKKNIAISQCLSDFKMAHEKGISLDDLIYYIKTDIRRW